MKVSRFKFNGILPINKVSWWKYWKK